MADLAVQDVVEAGIQANYDLASAGGDSVSNIAGDVVLHVKNGGGGPVDVTIAAQHQPGELHGFGTVTKQDAVVTIPAGGDRFIGPFPRAAFNDGSKMIQVTYSATTGVTIAALRVPAAVG